MDSHVQVHKGILKYFRDEEDPQKKVWYLDIPSGKIFQKPAKNLGTIKDFYSIETEKRLCTEIEDPLGKLNQRIRSFCEQRTESITFDYCDLKLMERYFDVLIFRSERTQAYINKRMILSGRWENEHDRNEVINLALNMKSPAFQRKGTMIPSILINRTDCHFVVPRNGYYIVWHKNFKAFVAPISPKGAILYADPGFGGLRFGYGMEVPDCKTVESMNIWALKCEYLSNQVFLASDRERDLLGPQEYLLKNRKAMHDEKEKFVHMENEMLKETYS